LPLVFLTLNGIGLGHISRARVLADAVAASGRTPAFFCQGALPSWLTDRYEAKHVGALWKLHGRRRAAVANEINAYARMTSPSVVVEDTHPAMISLPDTRRVITVRPTEFGYLRNLRRSKSRTFSFILCDAPGSPTWPYTEEETKTIAQWKWPVAGPLFRRATDEERAGARARYGVAAEERLCVFTMGGGGVQPGGNDVAEFSAAAESAARRLRARDRNIRLLFVRGPYFPADLRLWSGFEVVDSDPAMPALLAAADGAVVRPGYNTVWECIAGGTPFQAFAGTPWKEPVHQRVNLLLRFGFATKDLAAALEDVPFLRGHAGKCAEVSLKWSGTASESAIDALCAIPTTEPARRATSSPLRLLQIGNGPPAPEACKVHHAADLDAALAGAPRATQPYLGALARVVAAIDPHEVRFSDAPVHPDILDHPSVRFRLSASSSFGALRESVRSLTRKRLVVRMDDVVRIDAETEWLVRACVERRLPLSIEVIPYLNELRAADLDGLDGDGLLEVGQHGYSHLPRSSAPRAEFLEDDPDWNAAIHRLRSGREKLVAAFGGRFRGGFSAPYDQLPSWLPDLWRAAGGTYVSYIWNRPAGSRIPSTRFSTDVWDWSRMELRTPASIASELMSAFSGRGQAGLVLHARVLRQATVREQIEALLEALIDGRVEGASASASAGFPSGSLITSPSRVYDWAHHGGIGAS
jgi:peptidoglycan/xylan/chitin deacetylase (PgdA/CDA1 family)